MKNARSNLTSKAAELVENHSLLASLLAVLCLAFAVNFFLTGPGSDGGSGFGGTGKFGGESGFGGTGKTPDGGLKLGADDTDDADHKQYDEYSQSPVYSTLDALREELDRTTVESTPIASLAAITPKPEFDVSALRLSPEPIPSPVNGKSGPTRIDSLVADVALPDAEPRMDGILQDEKAVIAADTLVASLDILNSLILAEAEAALQIAEAAPADSASDAAIRQRVSVPVRPERPDRFTVPTRITPVSRVDIPAPPPVRPMRTLSSLLNR